MPPCLTRCGTPAKFFKVQFEEGGLSDAREAIGFIPWMFNLAGPEHAEAWLQIKDRAGFWAPWGITTAERRHPKFRSHGTGTCEWGGAVWPFASSQTLNGLASVIRGPEQPYVTRRDYFEQVLAYARAHQLDGKAYIGARYGHGAGLRNDSLGGNPIGNVIIDHVSASWGLDENLSMYRHMYQPPDGGKELKLPTVNITIQHSIINNYFKPGPVTNRSKPISYRLLKPEARRSEEFNTDFGRAYVHGNIVVGNERVIKMVRTGKLTFPEGKGIIRDVADIGGYPAYYGEPYADTDGDGMPNEWEARYGLDPCDPSDASKRKSGRGYTNIECLTAAQSSS